MIITNGILYESGQKIGVSNSVEIVNTGPGHKLYTLRGITLPEVTQVLYMI